MLVLLFSSGRSGCLYAQQLDSAKRVTLDQRITEYFDLLKYESLDVQKAEADMMIQAASDSLVRQYVALRIYDHYLGSPVMGAEGVAIYVFDRWFLPGKISMGSDMDLLNARIFADFNRQSLIGEKAPELVMETMQGDTARLFVDRKVKDGEKHKVVFFYDTSCAKCKLESIMLSNLLDTGDYPIDFYAVYTGDNREAWEQYASERFDIEAPDTSVVHLWDPALDSDFQRKYGVIQTPRLFLIGPDSVIKGRGLDTRALSMMLDAVFAHPDLEYGSKESEAYFDRLFPDYPEKAPSFYDVSSVVENMARPTLCSGDTTMCRQFLGDFLYYLAPKTGTGFREGTKYLIDNYILNRNDIWRSQDDSLKVIGFAQILDDLLSRSVPGSRIADLKVPGELLRFGKKIKSGKFKLRKLRADMNVVIFYTEGCHICDAEKAAARSLVSETKDVRVLMVNIDRIMAADPALANKLFDSFDLSSLPYILFTDRKGKITVRYATLQ